MTFLIIISYAFTKGQSYFSNTAQANSESAGTNPHDAVSNILINKKQKKSINCKSPGKHYELCKIILPLHAFHNNRE